MISLKKLKPKDDNDWTSITDIRADASHPKYRRDIDGLRALAVLAVVTFHAFPNWLPGGYMGVDVFFVISGYLISILIFENLDKQTFCLTEFYARRIKRIFPALLLVMTACLIVGWFALLANEYKQLGKHVTGGAGFISNLILWNETSYFDSAADTKPLLHLWSLGIEEQFYIAWPLVLWFAYKRNINLLTVTAIVCIASFMLNVNGVKHDVSATFFAPQTRFWELLCGSILAWVTHYKQREAESTLSNTLSLIGLLLLVYGFSRLNKASVFPGYWALLPVSGAVLIIAAGPQAFFNRLVLSNKVAVWVGLISFPLYLWHWPLLSFARIVEGGVTSRNVRIVIVAISFLLGWLTYRFIERPMRSAEYTQSKVSILVLLMVLIGCVGYGTYRLNGLGSRFDRDIRALTEYQYDYSLAYRLGSCFLGHEHGYRDFKNCDVRSVENTSTILIWGDSHAAHLYAGYKKLKGSDTNIIQFTAASCPPIMNIDIPIRVACREINDYVLGYIQNNSIDTLVLSAAWTDYDDLTQLEGTISTLKNIGINNIVLVGPVPVWNDPLPKLLLKQFAKTIPHVIPERMATGLNTNFIKLDSELRERSKQMGVRYISPKKILCDHNGCMTMTGQTIDTIIAWDSAHLTQAGSEHLVRKFLND